MIAKKIWPAVCILLFVGLVLLASFFTQSIRDFSYELSYRNNAGETVPLHNNRLPSDTDWVLLDIHLSLKPVHATTYEFSFDDCIHTLSVNGRAVKDERFPICNKNGVRLDLSQFVRTGTNILQLAIRIRPEDPNKGFEIHVPKNTPLPLLTKITAGAVLVLFGLLMFG